MQLCRFGLPSISDRQSKQTPIIQEGPRSLPSTGVSRMLRKPATRTAAAAEAPAGTKIVRPSTVTAMVAGSPSGRGRNIETACRKEVECRFEHARGDHRRKGAGMGAGEGDPTV